MGELCNKITLTDSARYLQITRQAVYVAVKHGKLPGTKIDNRWMFTYEDLNHYRDTKYSRLKSRINGELVFDLSKGKISAAHAAKMLKVPIQHIYYALRVGNLKSHRKGSAYVILEQDVKAYAEKHFSESKEKIG